MSESLTLERAAGGAVITLRAPERRNALTLEMAAAMIDACETIDEDRDVGAVIVTGEGGYFCAGGDRATLAEAAEDAATPATYTAISTIYGAFARVGKLEPPTIAAIRGGALGVQRGLAWRAVPDDEVDDRARSLAAVPASDPELARRTTASMRRIAGPPPIPWEAALDLERSSQMWSMRRKALGG